MKVALTLYPYALEAIDSIVNLLRPLSGGRFSLGCEGLQQPGMHTAECAVAHADDVVAWHCGLGDLLHDLVNGGSGLRPATDRRQRGCSIPVQTCRMAKSEIGAFQCPGQLRLHGAELHGIAARLEYGEDA